MEIPDGLRLISTTLAIVNLLLLFFLIAYLRTLYHPDTRGSDPRRWVPAKLGTFILLLYGLSSVAAAMASMRHFHDIEAITSISRMLVMAFQTGIFIVLLSWNAYTLEYRYRGRWLRVDRLIEWTLHLGR